MKQYVSSQWKEMLTFNHLFDFDTLWQLKTDWVEPPNYRRGGWSGVSKISLKSPEGAFVEVYLKRQENHCTRSFRHPLKGYSTFQREAIHILDFQSLGIPSLELVYFEERWHEGNNQAILMTKALTGYEPFDDWWQQQSSIKDSSDLKKKALYEFAKVVKKMHDHEYCHGALYPKHTYVKENEKQGIDIRLIDLEKTYHWPFKGRVLKDLGTLYKRAALCSSTDKIRFLKYYESEEPFPCASLKLTAPMGKIATVVAKRRRKKQIKKERREQHDSDS